MDDVDGANSHGYQRPTPRSKGIWYRGYRARQLKKQYAWPRQARDSRILVIFGFRLL
jgi:hypothetical protein